MTRPRRSNAIPLPDAASVARMCEAIGVGAPMRVAAMAEGFNAARVRRWMQLYQEEEGHGRYTDAMMPLARAHARMIINHIAVVTAAARGVKSFDPDGNERQGDWRASAWFLGRCCAEFRNHEDELAAAWTNDGEEENQRTPVIVLVVPASSSAAGASKKSNGSVTIPMIEVNR